ncbi:MAG: hypothetical protein FD130_1124, partial [Halothiobacillaceae bacterium]
VADQGKPVFIEATIDKTSPYVQEQVVLTIKLYHNVPIANGSLSNPDVKETAIERLGNDHTYRADKNGQNYEVIERRFALFPQQSGPLTIPPIVFEGAIPDPRNPNRFGGGILNDPFNLLQTNRPTKTRSEPLTLDVKAIPPSEANHAWLPAESLTVEESWSQGSNDLQVGVPVTRTVTIRAKGLSVAQLPKIALPEFPFINSYPDKSAESNDAQPDGITGVSQQKIAVIPSHPGDITLPEIRIPWWNIKTQQREEALIPARTLRILPATNQAATPPAPVASPPPIAPVEKPTPAATTPATPLTTPGYWPWATLLAVIAWLITLALWLRERRRAIPTAATTPNNAYRHSLKALQQELIAACQQHNPQQTKTALLNWATQQWPQQPPRSLGELKNLLQSEPAKSEVDRLETYLYHPEATCWQGDRLRQAMSEEWQLARQVVQQEGDGLVGLYPS